MIDWDKLKDDVWKGVKDGMEAVKEGAQVTAKKAGELKDEGSKRFHVYRLKKEIHEHMAELGVKIYKAEKEAPGTITDPASKDIIAQLDRIESELEEAEK